MTSASNVQVVANMHMPKFMNQHIKTTFLFPMSFTMFHIFSSLFSILPPRKKVIIK